MPLGQISNLLSVYQPITARDSQRHRSRPFQAGLPRGWNEKDRQNPTIMTTASADSPLKGLDTLLRAFALVLHDEPLVRLTLIGALKPDGDTRKLIEHLKIGHAIDEKGRVTAEEMVSLYQSATLAVVPSVYEGFGFPAGEAMACGVPLVSTSGGALPEVVGDAGITVPVQDPGAMAAAITVLLKDSERRHALVKRTCARYQGI